MMESHPDFRIALILQRSEELGLEHAQTSLQPCLVSFRAFRIQAHSRHTREGYGLWLLEHDLFGQHERRECGE